MEAVTVDDKGRILLPKRDREAHGIRPGSRLAIEWDGDVMRAVPVQNPFDALADEALAEYRAGETRRLRPRSR